MLSIKPNFRYDINALRAFAVLAVIAYHFDVACITGGFVGVDVFFVISGFLITSQIQQSLIEGRFSFGNFYASRLRRIFPALAVMCLAILLFGWFYVFPKEFIAHTKNAFEAIYFGSNHSFVKTQNEGYFDSVKTGLSPFLHTWSLSVEGQFYLVFPVLWLVIFKAFQSKQWQWMLLIFTLAFAYFMYDTAHHSEQSFYSLPVRIWEFLAGALLVLLPAKKDIFALPKQVLSTNIAEFEWSNLISSLALFGLAVSFYFLDATVLWPSYWTLLPVVSTVALIAVGSTSATNLFFNNGLIQRTGDMSYSLYLWHWPIIVFAKQVAIALNRALSSVEIAALSVTTVMAAYLSWRFVERPFRENRKYWTNKKMGFLFVLVLIVFWGVWRKVAIGDGMPNRFDKQIDQAVWEEMVKPPDYGAKCIEDQRVPINKDNTQVCKLNDNPSLVPEVLVWGDSHMHHYYPAWRKAAQDLSINGYFMTRGGCHAVTLGEESWQRYALEDEIKYCKDFNKNVHNNFLSQPSIKTVIIGRLWFDGEAVYQTITLVKELTEKGFKVVLIGAIPRPEFNVLDVMVKRKLLNLGAHQNITSPREKMAYLDGIDAYVKEELATQILLKKVIWIESMDYLCDSKDCYFVKDGVNNFWDASHITQRKALEFTEEFKRALQN